tara:strand:+ start:618 stop:1655 length:1038 start_codon:yes stop_codon:yes gene_type:complete
MKLSLAKTIFEASFDSQIANRESRDADRTIPYAEATMGIGKTSMVQQITTERDWGLYILSLASMDAAEVNGIIALIDGEAHRVMPFWLRRIHEMAASYEVVVLFLDELPQAPVANMNVGRQLINEWRVGEFELPHNVVICAAGNRMSDRAGTNNMPSHLKDCLMFLEIDPDVEDAIAYMVANGVHEDVTAYLRARPEFAVKFDRDANANPSFRSWDRVSTILSWGLSPVAEAEAIAGTVGRPATADFTGFRKMKANMPDLDGIISNPDGAEVPQDAMVLYAMSSGLAYRMTQGNAGNIVRYLKRLDQQEFAGFCIKDAVTRDPEIKKSEAVRQWIINGGADLFAA